MRKKEAHTDNLCIVLHQGALLAFRPEGEGVLHVDVEAGARHPRGGAAHSRGAQAKLERIDCAVDGSGIGGAADDPGVPVVADDDGLVRVGAVDDPDGVPDGRVRLPHQVAEAQHRAGRRQKSCGDDNTSALVFASRFGCSFSDVHLLTKCLQHTKCFQIALVSTGRF